MSKTYARAYDDEALSMTISGEFVQKGYYGLKNKTTGASMNEAIMAAFPKGAIVNVSFSATLTGQMPMCEAATKYGTCGEVLDNDLTCPSAKTHVTEEAEVTA